MIEGVKTKQLRVIPDERGFLMEMLRRDDEIFEGFGQSYITATYPGVVKGWHFHRKQTDHFVCIRGMAKVVLYDSREDSPTHGQVQEFFIGERNPLLVKIPPFVMHGFKAVGGEMAIIINIPTEPYDYKEPDEYRVPWDSPEIPYDWSLKNG
ncbi:MAG TPA: dTDP-4-dehydrorhamnose 3,5-epimerase family protein [Chloroflexota bacterium]|nr:dTDP-4-dehydrorhamnose 3,5-epimerase family protein [Chloroflexota bacterium]